jgi:hypothetical protein
MVAVRYVNMVFLFLLLFLTRRMRLIDVGVVELVFVGRYLIVVAMGGEVSSG